jgi:ketosteroid isomerase-like protein
MNDNVAAVQAMYEAFGRGDVPAILERLSPEVDWEEGRDGHGVPWLKAGRGREHVAAFFESLRQLDFLRFEPLSLLAGGNQVAAVIAVDLTVRATAGRIVDTEVHLWKFGADGKVAAFSHFVDTFQHVAALGAA